MPSTQQGMTRQGVDRSHHQAGSMGSKQGLAPGGWKGRLEAQMGLMAWSRDMTRLSCLRWGQRRQALVGDEGLPAALSMFSHRSASSSRAPSRSCWSLAISASPAVGGVGWDSTRRQLFICSTSSRWPRKAADMASCSHWRRWRTRVEREQPQRVRRTRVERAATAS